MAAVESAASNLMENEAPQATSQTVKAQLALRELILGGELKAGFLEFSAHLC